MIKFEDLKSCELGIYWVLKLRKEGSVDLIAQGLLLKGLQSIFLCHRIIK